MKEKNFSRHIEETIKDVTGKDIRLTDEVEEKMAGPGSVTIKLIAVAGLLKDKGIPIDTKKEALRRIRKELVPQQEHAVERSHA